MNVLLVYRAKTFKTEILPRLEEFKEHSITLIVHQENEKIFVKWLDSDKYIQEIYSADEFLSGELDSMKFDVIVGNPPYQNGTKNSDRNKIYNEISKKSIALLNDRGVISFITPITITRKSTKNFDIVDHLGLFEVDFSVNDSFNVGVEVCCWKIQKDKIFEKIKVINKNKSISYFKKGNSIYDSSKDIEFIELFEKLKSLTPNISDRMFFNNNLGSQSSKIKDDVWQYEIRTLKGDLIFSKKEPYFFKKKKWILSNTAAHKIDNVIIDERDYFVNYYCIDIENDEEIENINSFIFSDCFTNLANKYRTVFCQGFSYFIKYLPKFDKSKKWSNDEVKLFFDDIITKEIEYA